MHRTRIAATLAVTGALLLAGCASDAFRDIDGAEPVLPPEVEALSIELHTLRSLGEYDGITYVAAKSGRDDRCLAMYRTHEPSKPVVGCSSGPRVTVGGEDVGQATFFSEGNADPEDHTGGEQVSKWLVIHS